MNESTKAFEHNFYLTQEYAHFWSRVTKIPLAKQSVPSSDIYVIKNKVVALHAYTEDECAFFQKNKWHYMSVTPERNVVEPSIIEYSLFHKTTYAAAFKNYKTSFFHGLREGKKFPHEAVILRNPSEAIIQTIYHIYKDQMIRHNSFVFSYEYFEEFFKCPSSLLFTVNSGSNIIGYFCCFQYGDNLYPSIGGGNPQFFAHKSSNKLYDEVIRYACENQLNVHWGIGEHGSGYQKFKQNAGIVNYRTQKYPNDEYLLKIMFPLLQYRLTGYTLRCVSRLLPHLVAYSVMPTT